MIFCDPEAEYAQLLSDYLRRRKDLPWELHTYTDVGEMLRYEENREVTLLLVAESAYTEELQKLKSHRTLILNESGVRQWSQFRNVNKYQRADAVLRELLEAYAEIAAVQYPSLDRDCTTRLIGFYSPVHRSLQSSFALSLSQLLAQEHPTLYVNFEYCAGLRELVPGETSKDLSDVLYFLETGQDKFRLRLKTIIRKAGALDYIPPMRFGQNLTAVSAEEWRRLLVTLMELGEYEYIILDLSESVQGLFELLRMCSRIFTSVGTDPIAKAKMYQYEQLLELYEYEDVRGKTFRLNMPRFRRLPLEPEQYTRGELADYVREICKELKEL